MKESRTPLSASLWTSVLSWSAHGRRLRKDLARIHSNYGERIAFCGGVDARVLISNDRSRIDAELNAKVAPVLSAGGGYILSSDHSEPPEVDFETLQYFVEKGREMSRRRG